MTNDESAIVENPRIGIGSPTGRFVLVTSDDAELKLRVVVDLEWKRIRGHDPIAALERIIREHLRATNVEADVDICRVQLE